MASKNSTWIVLAIVVLVLAAGFYYYDADASATEIEQVEEVQAAIPADQAQRPHGAVRLYDAKAKNSPKQPSPPK